MSVPKRYFWMKLKESFMTSDTIDYFMSQPDGANYVVLYQMLCLKTINTEGKLSRQLGELIIPYDVEKIKRDCKWFSTDTIRVALKLYQAVGLIYDDVDGALVLTDHNNLVGSETSWAERKRNQRLKQSQNDGMLVGQCPKNVHPEIDIDIRDRDRDRYIDGDKKAKRNRFTPPTIEEVQAYCVERNNNVDPQRFIDYYTSNGWMIGGKSKMKDWKASVRTWERTEKERQPSQQKHGSDRIAEMVLRGDFDE